uniref:Uncharacterized protein n=1 Tax=Globodera rostochiensis TaxID=31243 RepID=A0A914IC06_GLORO
MIVDDRAQAVHGGNTSSGRGEWTEKENGRGGGERKRGQPAGRWTADNGRGWGDSACSERNGTAGPSSLYTLMLIKDRRIALIRVYW